MGLYVIFIMEQLLGRSFVSGVAHKKYRSYVQCMEMLMPNNSMLISYIRHALNTHKASEQGEER